MSPNQGKMISSPLWGFVPVVALLAVLTCCVLAYLGDRFTADTDVAAEVNEAAQNLVNGR